MGVPAPARRKSFPGYLSERRCHGTLCVAGAPDNEVGGLTGGALLHQTKRVLTVLGGDAVMHVEEPREVV